MPRWGSIFGNVSLSGAVVTIVTAGAPHWARVSSWWASFCLCSTFLQGMLLHVAGLFSLSTIRSPEQFHQKVQNSSTIRYCALLARFKFREMSFDSHWSRAVTIDKGAEDA